MVCLRKRIKHSGLEELSFLLHLEYLSPTVFLESEIMAEVPAEHSVNTKESKMIRSIRRESKHFVGEW